jgi:outer membrane protein OmpA-like peptidoglycan-associated protein
MKMNNQLYTKLYSILYKRTICIITALLIYGCIGAQENTYKFYTLKQILKMAENAEQLGDYYNAIDLYSYYIQKKEATNPIYHQLAENYRKSRNYIKASEYYKKIIDSEPDKYDLVHYYYADMLMRQAKYDEAVKYFEIARKKRPDKDLSDFIKQKIEGCKIALKVNFTNQRIRVIHPDSSINNVNTELSPIFLSNNKMVFSSVKSKPIEKYAINSSDLKLPVSEFFVAYKTNDTIWRKSGKWNFNDSLMYVGNGALSTDGNRFYFTKCQRQWNNTIQCAIYYSDKEPNGWSTPYILDNSINMPGYTSTQVTIGRESKRNRDVVYFVSDRPSGRGGTDIWYTIYNPNDDSYSKPANAGPKINTKGDEITPYYDLRSGSLYFSTDYLPGYGGLDVFMCKGEPRIWTAAENLGKLINSENDELYYTINPYKRNEGMFVSNRKGSYSVLHETCCDDIFFYRKETVDKIYIKGKILQDEVIADSVFAGSDVINTLLSNMGSENIIIDSSMIRLISTKTNKINKLNPLNKAAVSVYMIDSQTNEEIFIYSDSTNERGEYLQELDPLNNYKIVVKKDEYFNQNLNVSTKVIDWRDTIVLQDIALKPIPRKPIQLTVYYDINVDQLKDESKRIIDTTLLTILNESPELIVEISSHTDSIGLEQYNAKLSQKRAEIVVGYLTSKGIDKNRLIAIGYGETKPIAENTTAEGRSKNRRTEFKIVGSIDQFSKLNVTNLKILNKENQKNR